MPWEPKAPERPKAAQRHPPPPSHNVSEETFGVLRVGFLPAGPLLGTLALAIS